MGLQKREADHVLIWIRAGRPTLKLSQYIACQLLHGIVLREALTRPATRTFLTGRYPPTIQQQCF